MGAIGRSGLRAEMANKKVRVLQTFGTTALQSRILSQSRAASGLLAAAGACVVIAGSVLMPAGSLAHLGMVASGTAALLLATWLAARRSQAPEKAHQACSTGRRPFDERIDQRLEELRDVHWELSENEARLQAVLDAQVDIIMRRDVRGRVTFVNTAFTRTFGIEAAAVLGREFSPEVLACDASGLPNGTTGPDGRTNVVLVNTQKGPRWLAWEERQVSGAQHAREVQCTARDVTEARQSDLALKEARDQAEWANRAKSRFLAAMSHEIRTPMNGILGMASLLAETSLSPDQDTYVRAIDQSARNLLGLIDEILDFSKIEAGKLVLDKAPFSLAVTVQSVVELLAPAAEDKSLEIAWIVDPACAGQFLGDESRVRQILLNLVSNAVKFTDKGGILVTVAPAAPLPEDALPHRVRVSIEDTGIGLSDADRARVFAEFEQAEAAVRRRRGGTGLGLAICMGLARAMNGTIALESEVGKGSSFHVEIDLEPARGESGLGNDVVRGGLDLHVLLASDRPIEQRTLARVLRTNGIKVRESTPGDAAREIQQAAAAGTPVNRLIVDGTLDPHEAGMLLRAMKEAAPPELNVAGIVLVSMLARPGLAAFRSMGFDSYLVRPVRPHSLLEQLGALAVSEAGPADGHSAKQSPAGGDAAERHAPPRILLAEDNAINALLATHMLESAGCDVTLATDGLKAVEAMRGVRSGSLPRFELVLMDIHMPELDGLEATRAIMDLFAEAEGADVCPPIVALTANAFAEDREHYLACGMSDYLAKPFDADGLRRLLSRWLDLDGAETPANSAA